MIDNLKGQEELEVEKIKVTEAEIVVRGTVDKPYYVIVYHEVGKDYNNEGFGSYRLENVFKWRDERFEKVGEADWIPCEVSLPVPENEDGPYTANYVTLDTGEVAIGVYRTDDKVWYTRRIEGETRYTTTHNVIAWQPLPQPYKEEGGIDG